MPPPHADPMNEAMPPRLPKTKIERSRSGCSECRRKRRKCDEGKPSCRRCERVGDRCVYGVALRFRHMSNNPKSHNVACTPVSSGLGHTSYHELDLDPQAVLDLPGQDGQFDPLQNTQVQRCTSSIVPTAIPLSPDGSFSLADLKTIGLSPFSLDLSSLLAEQPVDQPSLTSPQSVYPADITLCDSDGLAEYHNESCSVMSFGNTIGTSDMHEHETTSLSTAKTPADAVTHLRLANDGYSQNSSSTGSPDDPTSLSAGVNGTTSRRYSQVITNSHTPGHNALGSMPNCSTISRNPHGSELTAVDRFYLAHFMLHVVDLLPNDLKILKNLIQDAKIVVHAAIALGAASLANLQGQFSDEKTRAAWIPKHSHMVNALRHSHLVSTKTASEEGQSLPTLAAQFILTYVESEVGSQHGVLGYVHSSEELIRLKHNELDASSCGQQLMRGIVYPRSIARFVSGPLVPARSESHKERFWQSLERRLTSTSGMIEMITSDAMNISHRIFLSKTLQNDGNDSPEKSFEAASQWYAILSGTLMEGTPMPQRDQTLGSMKLFSELRLLSQQLLECQLPKGTNDVQGSGEPASIRNLGSGEAWDITPVRLDSHDHAMDIASYAYARVMTDESLILDALGADASSELATTQPHPWLHILLRVAAWLNPDQCAYRNVYRRGIGVMLLTSAMRYVESFLERLNASGFGWENLYSPIPMIYQACQIVRRQLEGGRKVFLAVSSHNKFAEVSSVTFGSSTEVLALHGMESDGRFFSDYASLDSRG